MRVFAEAHSQILGRVRGTPQQMSREDCMSQWSEGHYKGIFFYIEKSSNNISFFEVSVVKMTYEKQHRYGPTMLMFRRNSLVPSVLLSASWDRGTWLWRWAPAQTFQRLSFRPRCTCYRLWISMAEITYREKVKNNSDKSESSEWEQRQRKGFQRYSSVIFNSLESPSGRRGHSWDRLRSGHLVLKSQSCQYGTWFW